MQTVLESLEQSYLNLLNLKEESSRENSCLDTYCREEVFCSLSELTKAIVLLVTTQDVQPTDSRVYIDIVEHNSSFLNTSEEIKQEFINKLYNNDILHREKTRGDLIEELKRFSPSLKVSLGADRSLCNKFVVDDTYLDKVVLVGVEN